MCYNKEWIQEKNMANAITPIEAQYLPVPTEILKSIVAKEILNTFQKELTIKGVTLAPHKLYVLTSENLLEITDPGIVQRVKSAAYVNWSADEVSKARIKYDEFANKSDSKLVNKSLNNVIPASDDLAVYRNAFKLAITAVGLLLVILSAAGIASTTAILGISLACLLMTFCGLAALVKMGKITPKDAIILAVMTMSTLFSSLYGGETAKNILIAIYSLSVMVQGALFAIPQGAIGWGKGGYDKAQIAKKCGDPKDPITGLTRECEDTKHKRSGWFGMGSGALSFVEGATWVFMGVLMLTGALSHVIPGCPELLPAVLPYVTAILFFVIFNISYINMIYSGNRDLKIQEKFAAGLKNAFQNGISKEDCSNALMYLRTRMVGKSNLKLENLRKRQNRLRRVMDQDSFELLKIENIDRSLAELNDDKKSKKAIEISQKFIKDILAANQRNIKLDQDQITIGVAGLLIGSLLSLIEEFVNPGSVIPKMPYVGNIFESLSQNALDALSSVGTIADCAFWAIINRLYKKCLDAPPGRTKEEEDALKDVKFDFEEPLIPQWLFNEE